MSKNLESIEEKSVETTPKSSINPIQGSEQPNNVESSDWIEDLFASNKESSLTCVYVIFCFLVIFVVSAIIFSDTTTIYSMILIKDFQKMIQAHSSQLDYLMTFIKYIILVSAI